MSFYEKNCDKPISKNEIIKYVNTNPKKLGIVEVDEDIDEDEDDPYIQTGVRFSYFTRKFLQSDSYSAEYDTIAVRSEENTHDFYVMNYFGGVGSPNIDTLIDYINTRYFINCDLLTIYNIYNNRGDCMNVNKNYAKNKIIDFLKKPLKQDSLYTIYYYYKYLLLTMFMFDIEYKVFELETLNLQFKNPQITSINHNFNTPDDIINDVEEIMENAVDMDEYYKLKNYMFIKIEEYTDKIIHHIRHVL